MNREVNRVKGRLKCLPFPPSGRAIVSWVPSVSVMNRVKGRLKCLPFYHFPVVTVNDNRVHIVQLHDDEYSDDEYTSLYDSCVRLGGSSTSLTLTGGSWRLGPVLQS